MTERRVTEYGDARRSTVRTPSEDRGLHHGAVARKELLATLSLALCSVMTAPADYRVKVSAKRDRNSGVYPEYPTGTFVVLMREAYSRRELFRARAEVPIDVDIAQLEEQIDMIVARIFAHYPTRVSGRP